jgi:hypothetical protein
MQKLSLYDRLRRYDPDNVKIYEDEQLQEKNLWMFQ